MNIRRKEFISEIKRLKFELAKINGRLSELEELAHPTSPVGASATNITEGDPFDGDDNSLAAKIAIALSKSRMNK